MGDIKKNHWIWLVTLFCLLLGMLLAAALKTQENIRIRIGGAPSSGGLVGALYTEKEISKGLRDKIKDLIADNQKYQDAMGSGGTKSELLSKELAKAKLLAGFLPAQGPGVEVTLKDSQKRLPPDAPMEMLEEYLIHDQDLRQVINELLGGGAEAISIRDKDNNQRIIATSPIRCTGACIRVNNVQMTQPFVIMAIGPKDTMESALKVRGGLIDKFRGIDPRLGYEMVTLTKSDNLIIPAYSEKVELKYAAEVKAGGG